MEKVEMDGRKVEELCTYTRDQDIYILDLIPMQKNNNPRPYITSLQTTS